MSNAEPATSAPVDWRVTHAIAPFADEWAVPTIGCYYPFGMENDWPSFLWDYLLAVREYWWLLVPDFLFVVTDGIARWRGEEFRIERKYYRRFFVLALILAQLLAYRNLAGKTHGLVGEINNTGLMKLNTGELIGLVEVAISNTGEPTIADAYQLQMTAKGKTYPSDSTRFWPTFIPASGLPLYGPDGKIEMFVKQTDDIMFKTSTPLPTGAKVDGWAFYNLSNVDGSDFWNNDVTFNVMFRDIRKHIFYAIETKYQNHTVGNVGYPPVLQPGGSEPFDPAIEQKRQEEYQRMLEKNPKN